MAGDRWFGVRCLFRHGGGSYEERVTIWLAPSLDAAIELAEQEAGEYVDGLDCEYLGFAQAYGPVMTRDVDEARDVEAGAEVFSLMRDSDLAPTQYIDCFFATGAEREQIDKVERLRDEVLRLLEEDDIPVFHAWWRANTLFPTVPSSRRLAWAEEVVRDLVCTGRASLVRGAWPDGPPAGSEPLPTQEVETALNDHATWAPAPEGPILYLVGEAVSRPSAPGA